MLYSDPEDAPALTREYIEACRKRDMQSQPQTIIDLPCEPVDPSTGLTLSVLGSGSKGNGTIVRAQDTNILIDCGFTCKDFLARCEKVGFDPLKLDAILITHEHTDHTKGLGVVVRHLARHGIHPRFYTTSAIHSASRPIKEIEDLVDMHHVSHSDDFDIGDMRVFSFETSHDSIDSMGFRIESIFGADGIKQEEKVLGYVTDTGFLNSEGLAHLRGSEKIALESNHDPHMLKIGPYPRHLQIRVAGDQGHLSNQQAACALEQLLHNDLKVVVGMHLSETNNLPRHSLHALREVVQHAQHPAQIFTASQRTPINFQ